MSENILGFVFTAGLGLLGFIVLAELAFFIRDLVFRRDAEKPKDVGAIAVPRLYLGAPPPVGSNRSSLLRRRHYRTLELKPRGRWGFALHWQRED